MIDAGVKHVSLIFMKTISIRELRQNWPEAESLLRVENEIVITRDSEPVAKLVRYVKPEPVRRRFDPIAHGKWQKRMSGGKVTRWVDQGLLRERDER
jgi:antitoxin (DNA-binding transcriptional repressor) of toxin-antitoxin stability system